MAKILLVEDDQNLSEIYNARLSAEGYEVVSAANGEDALAVASQEKPDLVISDVMMPRVSGFEMLDILKHTDGMQGVKVIMLTALGQDNDRSKASELGADRYLVKSQVTLEDIVTTAKELLGDTGEAEPDLNLQATQVSSNPSAFASNDTQSGDQNVASMPAPTVSMPTFNNEPAPVPAPQPQLQVSMPPTAEPAAAPAAFQPTAVPVEQTPIPVATSVEPAQTSQQLSQAPEQTQSNFQPASSVTPEEAPQQTMANDPLTQAEPIAEEEAELTAQLNNASVIEDLGGPTQPENPAPDSLPEQPISIDTPIDPQQNDDTTLQASETGPATSQEQAPEALSQQGAAQPQLVSPPQSVAPISVPNQPPETNQPSASQNHDELLASALKELESNDPNQPSPAAHPTSDNPVATTPTSEEQKAERKVILPPDQSSTRPDINELLSKEESLQTGAAPAPAAPASQVISPNTANTGYASQNPDGIDPSSISL